MEEIKLICKMCGNEFVYFKRSNGVLPKYCSDECRQKAVKVSKKKYLESCKDKKAAKRRLKEWEEAKQIVMPQGLRTPLELENIDKLPSDAIVITEPLAYKREILPTADNLTIKVLDFAQRLGQLKYEGHELLNELNTLKSEQDKQDQNFLHLVESMDEVTMEAMREIWKKEADNRTNRRDAKTLYSIVNQLIYGIPQNPHQYAKGIIAKKEKANEYFSNKAEGDND